MQSARILRTRLRRRQKHRRNPLFFLIQLVTTLFFLFFITTTLALAGGIGGVWGLYSYLTSELPDFTELEKLGGDSSSTFETTKIYAWGEDKDQDGNKDPVLIYEIIDPSGGDRQWVSLNQIPLDVANATVSIEDKTFWNNQGFDMEGIGRAFYEYVVKGGLVQGGSSITQQVVKNNLIEQDRRTVGDKVGLEDYRRKVEELVLSSRISRVYTKEQIMEWYLNTNFYGNLAYGIEAAARVYFNKSASQLTLAEIAMLVSIPQSPAYNPIDNPKQAKSRQELVLSAMYREGYIDRKTMMDAQSEPIMQGQRSETRFDIISPHFAFYARQELEKRFGREYVLRGGLRVYTTLDLTMQAQAECVTKANLVRLKNPAAQLPPAEAAQCEALKYLPPLPTWGTQGDHNVDNAAVVMLDPRTAEIKAMVGSADYWNDEISGRFNVAADGLRQPGSSFKPFTYITALTKGYNAATMMLDVETDFGTPYNGIPYVPQNYDRKFNGPMRMRIALANSFNVPAVEMMARVGVDEVIRMAHKLGITTLEEPSNYGLPLTLGGGEVKLIDMTYAYSVFANRGLMIGEETPPSALRLGFRTLDPVSILRVEDSRGKLLYEYNQPKFQRIITEQQSFILNDMLSDPKARCLAFDCPNSSLELPDGRVASVKTGTTNSYRDDWTIGYTPQLVVGVWVGNTDNQSMNDLPSVKGAAPLWHALMAWGLQNEPKIAWLPPLGVKKLEVCDLNGLLYNLDCPRVEEYFIEGTEPKVIDNMYQRFRINPYTGRLATAATPPEAVTEEVFIVYPDEAADWARENKKPRPPSQFDEVNGYNWAVGETAILYPEPFAFVRGYVNIIGNARDEQFRYFNVLYYANDNPKDVRFLTQYAGIPTTNELLGQWNTLNIPDGAYTLVVQVYDWNDQQVGESRVEVTVDNTPPSAEILFPINDSYVFVEDEFVVIQAQIIEQYAVNQVLFYADNAGVPFAINTVPPYTEKWNISGPGCHSFYVQVFDDAGNVANSKPNKVCFIGR